MERRGARAGRSLKKSVDWEGRVWWGMRASEEMVAMMPRWVVGVETSSLKASCSSFEAVMPDCMVPTYEAGLTWTSYQTLDQPKDASAAEMALSPTFGFSSQCLL